MIRPVIQKQQTNIETIWDDYESQDAKRNSIDQLSEQEQIALVQAAESSDGEGTFDFDPFGDYDDEVAE